MNRAEANAQILAQAMATLLSGGLVINDSEREYPYEHAVMYVAAAQLRALNIAIAQPDPDCPEAVGKERGWCRGEPAFNVHDTMAAVGAVAALLDVAQKIMPIMREELELAEQRGAQ